jgi:hypothetical protein
MVSSSGGGPSIGGSPEQIVVALVLVAIVAVVWFWKFAD